MIDRTKTLPQIHADLCVQYRKLLTLKASLDGMCTNCDQPEIDHMPDGRCSINALSRHFQWKDQPALDRVNRALVLIEELLTL